MPQKWKIARRIPAHAAALAINRAYSKMGINLPDTSCSRCDRKLPAFAYGDQGSSRSEHIQRGEMSPILSQPDPSIYFRFYLMGKHPTQRRCSV